MYVAEFGSEDAPTVLFLHGGMVAGWMWAEQAEALTDFHCLVPDLPGFSESYDDPWVSLAQTAVSLTTLIAEKAHGGKAHVVGLSLGAVVALHLAAHAPERIDRMILSGTLTRPMTGPMVTMQKLMLSLYHTSFGARLIAGMFRIPADGIEAFMRTAKITPKVTNQRAIDEIYAKPLPEGVTAVTHPTLVVSGSKDMAITREGVPYLVETLPNAVGYLVPNVGHTWNAENPYLFNDMINAWLKNDTVPATFDPVEITKKPAYA